MHSYAPGRLPRIQQPSRWEIGDLAMTGVVLLLLAIGLQLFAWIDSWTAL